MNDSFVTFDIFWILKVSFYILLGLLVLYIIYRIYIFLWGHIIYDIKKKVKELEEKKYWLSNEFMIL